MKNDGTWFDTLSNTSPCRNTDPRNDEDYDTFLDYASNAPLEGNYRELEQAILRYNVLKELPAQFRR